MNSSSISYGKSRERKGKEEAASKEDVVGKDGDSFPEPETCLMIFGGSDANHSKHQHKVRQREVCAIDLAISRFLRWSCHSITFHQRDHPLSVPRPGQYPLIIDPIIKKKHLSWVLMDGGSGLNILYVETLDLMRIPHSRL